MRIASYGAAVKDNLDGVKDLLRKEGRMYDLESGRRSCRSKSQIMMSD